MKSKSSTKAATANEIPPAESMQIETVFILPDPNQPRKHFDQKSLEELAESLRTIGMVQPVVVHPNDAGGFDLICGERRLRAAKIAGLSTIPARVYPRLSEDMVRELQIIENLHRENVNPMEESDAFFDLTKRGLTTAEDIARRLGKSTGYVYDRLALQNCLSDVQELIRNGTLSISHAKQFARLRLEDQKELFEKLTKNSEGVTLSEIKKEIEDYFSMNLANAPFDIEDPELVPGTGSCLKCPKRSGCNGLLFDDVASKDICFDKSCFESKTVEYLTNKAATLREEGKMVFFISERYRESPKFALQCGQVIDCSIYDHVDAEDEKFQSWNTFGIVVVPDYKGVPQIGSVIKIRINDEHIEREYGWLEEADEDDDTIDQNDDESRGSSNREPFSTGDKFMDHSEKFSMRLTEKLINVFENSQDPIFDPLVLIQNQITQKFNFLDTNLATCVAKRMGWDIILDSDDEIDAKETIKRVFEKLDSGSVTEAVYLWQLIYAVSALEESYWSRSDIQDALDKLPGLQFDISAEMDAYEKENNHQFPE